MATRTSTKSGLALDFHTAAALRAWGRRFAKQLRRGDVVALIGGLGAGKTTLVQGIAAGWGFKQGATSPTFALANEYRSPRGAVYHMDMYRLSERELAAFPLEDYWQDGLCLIEWADRVEERWPSGTLALTLKAVGPSTRRLSARSLTKEWRERLAPISH